MDSDLPVSFQFLSKESTGKAKITGSQLEATQVGQITVRAYNNGNGEYNPSEETQTFSVTKAPLSVGVQDAERNEGAPNPDFKLTYSGFVSGDNKNKIDNPPSVSTDAHENSKPGTYTISLSGGSDDNYDLSLTNGVLTVSGLESQVISFQDLAEVTYGDTITLEASSTSGLPIHFEVVSGSASIDENQLTARSAGSLTIRAVCDGNDEYYAAAPVEKSINVNKSTLTITASSAHRRIGDPNPQFTAEYTGLLFNDIPSTLDSPVSFTTDAQRGFSCWGIFDHPARGLSDSNYTFIYESGTLTINDLLSQTITFDDILDVNYGEEVVLNAQVDSDLPIGFLLLKIKVRVQVSLSAPIGFSLTERVLSPCEPAKLEMRNTILLFWKRHFR